MILARTQLTSNYVATLRGIIGYFIGYVNNITADQAENVYEMLKNDAQVAHGIHFLSLQIAGETFTIDTPNEELSKIIMFGLKQIRDFTHARKSLAASAVLFGLGIQKKEYTTKKYNGFSWKVPTALREIDRRRLRIEYSTENKNEQYWTVWSPKYDAYVVLEDRNKIPDAEYSLQDYVWFMHDFEETSPYFRGFGEVLYPLIYTKQKLLQYWGDLSESWAKPFLIALIDPNQGTINSIHGNSVQERVDSIFDSFTAARARHMVVGDKRDKFEYHEMGNVGNNLIKEYIEYIDTKIELLLIGSKLTTGTGESGSYALGHIHRGSTQSIITYNRVRLEEVLVQDLIMDFLWQNRINLNILNIEMPDVSDVAIKIRVESEELQKKALQNDSQQSDKSMGEV